MAAMVIALSEGGEEEAKKQDSVIRSIEGYVLSINSPKSFSNESEDNILRTTDLAFENLVTSMEEAGINAPKGLTVFEFNSKLDYFEKKNKQNAK